MARTTTFSSESQEFGFLKNCWRLMNGRKKLREKIGKSSEKTRKIVCCLVTYPWFGVDMLLDLGCKVLASYYLLELRATQFISHFNMSSHTLVTLFVRDFLSFPFLLRPSLFTYALRLLLRPTLVTSCILLLRPRLVTSCILSLATHTIYLCP